MHRLNRIINTLVNFRAYLPGLVAIPSIAVADIQLDAQASIGASDNINLAFEEANEVEDVFHSVATRFLINGTTRYTATNFVGNLQYFNYVKGTFDSDVAGGATFDFAASTEDERFRWIVTDNYGQQTLDPLQFGTPANRNGVNIFRTGPEVNLPLGQRNTLGASVIGAHYFIEEADSFENVRGTSRLTLTREHSQNFSTTLGTSYEAVEFREVEGVDFDVRDVFLTFAAIGRLTNLSVTVGYNEVEGSFGDNNGVQYSAQMIRRVGSEASVSVQFSRGFNDAGNIFRFLQGSFIDVGATQDIFTTPDPFENTLGFITFNKNGTRSSFALQGFWRNDEFETRTELDRNEFGVRAFYRRDIGRNWELLLNGTSVRRDLEGLGQEDDTHLWSIQVMRNLGRRFAIGLRYDYILRDQNLPDIQQRSNQGTLFINYRRQRLDGGTRAFSPQVF